MQSCCLDASSCSRLPWWCPLSPPTAFYWFLSLLWSSKALPKLNLDTVPPPAYPSLPYLLQEGREWPEGAREWHGIIIFFNTSLSTPCHSHNTSHNTYMAQLCTLNRVSILNTGINSLNSMVWQRWCIIYHRKTCLYQIIHRQIKAMTDCQDIIT